MNKEKKDLEQLRRMIVALQNKAEKMHIDETSFVISDRLHDELDGEALFNWLNCKFEMIIYQIDCRTLELME